MRSSRGIKWRRVLLEEEVCDICRLDPACPLATFVATVENSKELMLVEAHTIFAALFITPGTLLHHEEVVTSCWYFRTMCPYVVGIYSRRIVSCKTFIQFDQCRSTLNSWILLELSNDAFGGFLFIDRVYENVERPIRFDIEGIPVGIAACEGRTWGETLSRRNQLLSGTSNSILRGRYFHRDLHLTPSYYFFVRVSFVRWSKVVNDTSCITLSVTTLREVHVNNCYVQPACVQFVRSFRKKWKVYPSRTGWRTKDCSR